DALCSGRVKPKIREGSDAHCPGGCVSSNNLLRQPALNSGASGGHLRPDGRRRRQLDWLGPHHLCYPYGHYDRLSLGFLLSRRQHGLWGPQDYNLADIATVDWSIDPTTFDLSLLLTTNLIPFGVFQSAILLTNQPGLHPNPCGASTPDTG